MKYFLIRTLTLLKIRFHIGRTHLQEMLFKSINQGIIIYAFLQEERRPVQSTSTSESFVELI